MKHFGDLRRDLQYALRMLARTPGFTLAATLPLALGIGVNTAIFSVVNALLLRPLPYQDADRLVALFFNQPAEESRTGAPHRLKVNVSVGDLVELRRRTSAISDAGVSGLSFVNMTGGDGTSRLEGARMSPSLFRVFGVRPLLGRVFNEEDARAGAEPVILLGYGTWRRHFAGGRGVIGSTVTLDDVFARVGPPSARPADSGPTRYTVIGVMPERFEPAGGNQFWIPFGASSSIGNEAPRGALVARLSEGVSPAAGAAEVGAIVRELQGQKPLAAAASGPPRFEFVRQQDEIVAPVRPALVVLSTAVAFVLLIACLNVANLIFARTAARQEEMAIRAALGAGRGRLIRQLLTEGLLLSLLGGAIGIALSYDGVRLLRILGTTISRMDLGVQLPFPRLQEVEVDATVLVFAVAASVLTGIVSSLGPALRHSRAVRGDDFRSRAPRARTSGALVVAQIAVAVVLLVGGALLIRSFVKVSSVELGYDPSDVLTFQVGLPDYSGPRLKAFSEELVGRLRSVPGVRSAAYARQLPLIVISESYWFRRTPALPDPPPPQNPDTAPDARIVSRDYFDVMRISILEGHAFGEGDGAGRPRVMLVNQTLARREFPNESPIGKFVYAGRDSEPWEIIGVVADVRQSGPDREPRPQFFGDYRQWPESDAVMFTFLGPYYALRIDGDAARVVREARAIARGLDAHAGLFSVAYMDDLLANRVSRPRMYAVLAAIFAGLAVAVAGIGIYGVVAYSVAQRTREIGIRTALGARRLEVMALVAGRSLTWTTTGILLGLAAAAALTRYLEGMLFGLTPLDRTTFVAVAILFSFVAAVASYLPARRATRVDPLVALRCE